MMQRAAQGEDIRRDWTPIEDISPYLAYAVIGAEDARFCAHHGIDWKAVEQVLEERERTGRRRGGSTITQQTAKNVFLWNGGGWARKLPETWLALYIDTVWSKRRIMEVYLNVAEWGDGIFGAEAAAQARFGKPASQLNPREAALLAAVLPSPNRWRLDPPGDYVSKRARTLQTHAADVNGGGYGQCLKLDTDGLFRPAPKPAPEPEPEPIADNLENIPAEAGEPDLESQRPAMDESPESDTPDSENAPHQLPRPE